MNQTFFASIILALGIVSGAYLIGSHGFSISTAPAMKTLQVSAEWKVKITPDTTVLSAGVELHGRQTQEQAYSDMNVSIAKVRETLKANGIEEKNIQTASLYASPEYQYLDGKQNQIWYQASTTLTIRIEKKDPKVTNDILDAISKIENIRINGVDYDLAEKEKVYAEARKLALEKAHAKADEMAKVAGVTIIGVANISENGNNYPIPMMAQNYRAMDMANVSEATEKLTNVSLGQIEYTTSVNVSYEIR